MDNLALYYFHQGTSCKAYELLGAHYFKDATIFRVYAPHAKFVCVVGDFNDWSIYKNPMTKINNEGIWEVEIKGVKEFDKYQYGITLQNDSLIYKSDPYAFHSSLRPEVASKVYNLDGYTFNDSLWMKNRCKFQQLNKPLNIYEMHFGSWRKFNDGNFFNYANAAKEIVDYVKDMGYTHIELLPLSEYPYDPSWGYQVTGYYAITSRYGTPKDFMYFVDLCHQNGIGVIMDWVPGHFNKDSHGLIEFDGTYLYEPSDEKKRENKGWGTRCFDYGRCEVQSFLVSNAIFLIDKFHIDGIRSDAVSSMLYLDFCRGKGEWEPNNLGTNINLEGLALIKKINEAVHNFDKSVIMIAEESTAYPFITKKVSEGGLGYNYKWNMGWMNDTLKFIETNPLWRGDHLNEINFQMTYAFSENYILALSHDEVVHLKKSLIEKMPGSYLEKFASLKTYLTYQMTHPGKKLNFMGYEIGQFSEWNETKELDWSLLSYDTHKGLNKYIKDLNKIYKKYPALYDDTTYWNGFTWLKVDDKSHSVFSYERKCGENTLIIILNFAYCDWYDYLINIQAGNYKVILCSDDKKYNGNDALFEKEFNSNGSIKFKLPSNCAIILEKRN